MHLTRFMTSWTENLLQKGSTYCTLYTVHKTLLTTDQERVTKIWEYIISKYGGHSYSGDSSWCILSAQYTFGYSLNICQTFNRDEPTLLCLIVRGVILQFFHFLTPNSILLWPPILRIFRKCLLLTQTSCLLSSFSCIFGLFLSFFVFLLPPHFIMTPHFTYIRIFVDPLI